jgi:hypothetical protein
MKKLQLKALDIRDNKKPEIKLADKEIRNKGESEVAVVVDVAGELVASMKSAIQRINRAQLKEEGISLLFFVYC